MNVKNVNTVHYGRGITNAMYKFLTSGYCDHVNVEHAATRGAAALQEYVREYIDPLEDALSGISGDEGETIVALLVGAGLDDIDWRALADAIYKKGSD